MAGASRAEGVAGAKALNERRVSMQHRACTRVAGTGSVGQWCEMRLEVGAGCRGLGGPEARLGCVLVAVEVRNVLSGKCGNYKIRNDIWNLQETLLVMAPDLTPLKDTLFSERSWEVRLGTLGQKRGWQSLGFDKLNELLQFLVQPHLIRLKGQQPGRQWVPTCQPEVTQLAVLGRGDTVSFAHVD